MKGPLAGIALGVGIGSSSSVEIAVGGYLAIDFILSASYDIYKSIREGQPLQPVEELATFPLEAADELYRGIIKKYKNK